MWYKRSKMNRLRYFLFKLLRVVCSNKLFGNVFTFLYNKHVKVYFDSKVIIFVLFILTLIKNVYLESKRNVLDIFRLKRITIVSSIKFIRN